MLGFLIIGLVAGWLAGRLMKGEGFGLSSATSCLAWSAPSSAASR